MPFLAATLETASPSSGGWKFFTSWSGCKNDGRFVRAYHLPRKKRPNRRLPRPLNLLLSNGQDRGCYSRACPRLHWLRDSSIRGADSPMDDSDWSAFLPRTKTGFYWRSLGSLFNSRRFRANFYQGPGRNLTP